MAVDTTEARPATSVTVERHNPDGDVIDKVELDATIFGVVPNVPLMHQVVTAQLAARRSGTQSTKTRSEVAGGGAKPYRQKGTGRARQGTIRAPHYTGGGVALGPKPRSYKQRTPRKMVRLALHSALSDRVAVGRLCILDSYPFEVPKTKDAVKLLNALSLEGRILVVLGPDDALAERSFANLPHVDLVEAGQLTAYEVLANEWVLFSSETVPGGVTIVPGSAEAAAEAAESGAAVDGDVEAEVSPPESSPTDAATDVEEDDHDVEEDDVEEDDDEEEDEEEEDDA